MIDDKKIEEAARGAADLYEQDLPIMSYEEDTEVDGQHPLPGEIKIIMKKSCSN